ncbi:MAG: hypothetical protein JWR05_1055 [Mucilaginibacter sp.]|nr:hypothetical protein [Mucilaginibacter sp.]
MQNTNHVSMKHSFGPIIVQSWVGNCAIYATIIIKHKPAFFEKSI